MKKMFFFGAAIGILIGLALTPKPKTKHEYEIRTVRDTVTVVKPVAVAVRETIRVETHTFSAPGGDSVRAIVPITSVLYTGEGYRARISGFRPSLDSLVFEHAVSSVTVKPQKPTRWAVGIQTGVAATPKGIQPFVGIGITYKLLEF